MKRTPFKRKPPAPYVKPERIFQNVARLTVKVNMPRVDDAVVVLPKEDAIYSEPYRRLVAARPCIHCHIEGYSQAAHPPPTGKAIKADDRECFPLCCIHPDGTGELVPGCHADFDQYRLVPKADMRCIAGHWASDTRRQILDAGDWPANLPRLDMESA